MTTIVLRLFLGTLLMFENGIGCKNGYNITLEPTAAQLCEFKRRHPRPLGVLTLTAGRPLLIQELITLNSIDLMDSEFFLDTMMHFNHERIPERVVHAKGFGVFGYFEVTHDISKYTKAEVFNGIGKRTPIFARLSTELQPAGGPDVMREVKGLALKFYTKEGILDFLCVNIPIYLYKDPSVFSTQIHARRRNPRTAQFDTTAEWNFFTSRPSALNTLLHVHSELGMPQSYRHMDAFPIHTFALNNKKGEVYYAKFNFRTNQGIKNLTLDQIPEATQQLDYYARDLYNSIERKNYPSWTLELDIMTLDDIKHLDYNPFDVTRYWKNGTYKTVTVGQLILNRNPDNQFMTSEVSGFNVANLVPGIPGPSDTLFQGRRLVYRDSQNYRIGINHNNIDINKPHYSKTYLRDGLLPLDDNMRDAPNYYPNSFNGPEAIVDESTPTRKLRIIESNAVDLQPMADFYNLILKDDIQRQSLAEVLANKLTMVVNETQKDALRMLSLISSDLGSRVRVALDVEIKKIKNIQSATV